MLSTSLILTFFLFSSKASKNSDLDPGCVDSPSAQAQKRAAMSANPSAALTTTGTVIKTKFCEFDDGKYTTIRVSLDLSLFFTNTGTYPLLLHRENNRNIGGLKIAQSIEDLEARHYEHTTIFDQIISGPPPEITEFERLGPGRSYATRAKVDMLIPLDAPDFVRILDGKSRYMVVWIYSERLATIRAGGLAAKV